MQGYTIERKICRLLWRLERSQPREVNKKEKNIQVLYGQKKGTMGFETSLNYRGSTLIRSAFTGLFWSSHLLQRTRSVLIITNIVIVIDYPDT